MVISTNKSEATSSKVDTESIKTLGATILATSLADAQLLMMTAAERGIELDEEIIKSILETEDAFNKNLITPTIATSFWQAYDLMSRALEPITIDSVRATHNLRQLNTGIWGYLQGRMYVPFSSKSAFRYKLLSISTLLMLILLQVFWSIGNTLVEDIKDQSDHIIEFESQLSGKKNKETFRNGVDLSKSLSSDSEAAKSLSQTQVSSKQENSSKPNGIQNIDRELDAYISWRNAEIIELKNWNRIWGRIIFFNKQTWEKPAYNKLSAESKIHVHYVSAQYVLHAISAYFLPILYGLLGASFYILRQLPKDIKNLTFSMNSHIDYSLRITQGPLAGIMASFFFTEAPSKLYSLTSHSSAIATIKLGTSSLESFSPLAIAFLAGYSVELIFYVIDKIISAVTSRSTTTKPISPALKPVSIKK